MDQELPQKIHAVTETTGDAPAALHVVPFDFRKPGQTPGSQIRAIYALKQKFLHRVVSSLSA